MSLYFECLQTGVDGRIHRHTDTNRVCKKKQTHKVFSIFKKRSMHDCSPERQYKIICRLANKNMSATDTLIASTVGKTCPIPLCVVESSVCVSVSPFTRFRYLKKANEISAYFSLARRTKAQLVYVLFTGCENTSERNHNYWLWASERKWNIQTLKYCINAIQTNIKIILLFFFFFVRVVSVLFSPPMCSTIHSFESAFWCVRFIIVVYRRT